MKKKTVMAAGLALAAALGGLASTAPANAATTSCPSGYTLAADTLKATSNAGLAGTMVWNWQGTWCVNGAKKAVTRPSVSFSGYINTLPSYVGESKEASHSWKSSNDGVMTYSSHIVNKISWAYKGNPVLAQSFDYTIPIGLSPKGYFVDTTGVRLPDQITTK